MNEGICTNPFGLWACPLWKDEEFECINCDYWESAHLDDERTAEGGTSK